MKLFSIFILLSLVFSHIANAAPEEKSIIDMKQASPEEFPNEKAIESLAISEHPPVKKNSKKEKAYYFLYDSSLALKGGLAYLVDPKESQSAVGIIYSKYQRDRNALEASFSSYGSEGILDFGKKYLHNEEGRFRWHYGWQVGLSLDADKGLANLLNFKKILLGAKAGYEQVFSDPFSLRNDFRVFFGKDEVYLELGLALAYSW